MTAQKPLYKRGVNNNLIWWGEICLEDACSYRTFSGVQGGKITESKPTKCSYKNIGRQNEVSPKQQAMKQLQALRAKKIKEGYSENEPGVFEKQQQQQKKFEPVLAETYSKYVDKIYDVNGNLLDDWAIQPKLDGIRCIARWHLTSIQLFTRSGKQLIIAAPHILHQINNIVNKMLREEKMTQEFLEKHFFLDGELYNHSLRHNFNKITSLCRKSNHLTQEDLIESKKFIRYFIYDGCIDNKVSFTDRWFSIYSTILNELEVDRLFLVLVETVQVISRELVETQYKRFLAEGYEV